MTQECLKYKDKGQDVKVLLKITKIKKSALILQLLSGWILLINLKLYDVYDFWFFRFI